MKAIDLRAAIACAEPGVIIEYHRGFLARDCDPLVLTMLDQTHIDARETRARAWGAYQAGDGHLVQRKNGMGEYSYLFIKRAHVPNGPANRP